MTTSNRFGFKNNHSTDLCLYAKKDILVSMADVNSNIDVFLGCI